MTTTPTNLASPLADALLCGRRSCSFLLVRTRHHTRPSRPLPPLWAGPREARGLGHLLAGRLTRHLTTNEEPAMTTTTTRPTTGERSVPSQWQRPGRAPGHPRSGPVAHLGAARVRPVRRHAGHLDRQRGASVDPDRPRARRCRRHVDRERVRRRLRRPAAAVRTRGRPVRPTRHVHSGLGPVHRRHAASSRGRGPGAAAGGPRRPGRRRRRTQPCRHVTAHAGLPRSSTSQGNEHLGRRLDAGRSHGGRARAACSPAHWVGGRCSS